jgi:tRNA pseudouridine38-40 synthase
MTRYRFIVEYFGAPFAGWQLQENARSVQGELERALAVILRHPVRVTGAGRTDAGVHATGQVAHFDFDGEVRPGLLERGVNALTRPAILIRRLEPCPPDFHARYSAISRLYLYRIALRPVALLHALSWHPFFSLDLELLQLELSSALGKHDFVNFSVPRKDGKSTQCNLLRAEVGRDGTFLNIHVEADRFLHKMVRSLVGAAVEVARGAHPPGLVRAILEGRFRGTRIWAPPQGLCLEKVKYSD